MMCFTSTLRAITRIHAAFGSRGSTRAAAVGSNAFPSARSEDKVHLPSPSRLSGQLSRGMFVRLRESSQRGQPRTPTCPVAHGPYQTSPWCRLDGTAVWAFDAPLTRCDGLLESARLPTEQDM